MVTAKIAIMIPQHAMILDILIQLIETYSKYNSYCICLYNRITCHIVNLLAKITTCIIILLYISGTFSNRVFVFEIDGTMLNPSNLDLFFEVIDLVRIISWTISPRNFKSRTGLEHKWEYLRNLTSLYLGFFLNATSLLILLKKIF